MEFASNLACLAVALALWGSWWFIRRAISRRSRPFGLGLQLIALAVLTAIVVPVISVTDDLQDCQNPAEVERSVRNADAFRGGALKAPDPPQAILTLLCCLGVILFRVNGFLSAESQAPRRTISKIGCVWDRPPPAQFRLFTATPTLPRTA